MPLMVGAREQVYLVTAIGKTAGHRGERRGLQMHLSPERLGSVHRLARPAQTPWATDGVTKQPEESGESN